MELVELVLLSTACKLILCNVLIDRDLVDHVPFDW